MHPERRYTSVLQIEPLASVLQNGPPPLNPLPVAENDKQNLSSSLNPSGTLESENVSSPQHPSAETSTNAETLTHGIQDENGSLPTPVDEANPSVIKEKKNISSESKAPSPNNTRAASTPDAHPLLQTPIRDDKVNLPKSQPDDYLKFIDYPTCDVAFESTVCFFNQEYVLLPPARPYGLIGHYTFDTVQPIDTSGHRNHAVGNTLAAFPVGTSGSSALFRKNYIYIPHSTTFGSTDYSITFWVYLLEDDASRATAKSHEPLTQWCPLLHKGVIEASDTLLTGSQMESRPSLMIDPVTGHLKIQESTNEVEATEGEFFIGNFRLRPHKWYHIAYIRHQQTSRLYIDGIMDSTMKTKGITRDKAMPFYIGGSPWTDSICDVPVAIDNLKIYSIAIGREIVHAEASPALGGIEPAGLFFSCRGCTKIQAEEGCPELFHLCTKIELMMGGYQVIAKFGLISRNSIIFTGETVHELEGTESNTVQAILLKLSIGVVVLVVAPAVVTFVAVAGDVAEESQKGTGVGFCCRDVEE